METNKETNALLARYIERTDHLQDEMKREFGNVHVRINHLEMKFDVLEMKVDEGFRLMNERMDRIDARMNQIETTMNEGFARIFEMLARIEAKLDYHDSRITGLEVWRNSYPS